MKQSTYHELNPLVRLKELELLTPELITRMLKAEDSAEVEALFRGTIFCQIVFLRVLKKL